MNNLSPMGGAMKVLLIYPEFPDTFWSFKHALKFIRKRSASPPLGLLTVAAMLPLAWEKRLVDLNVQSLTDKDLAWADVAFVSAMTAQRKSTYQVIERCKAHGLKIVAGGPLFTTEYEQFYLVDHFVLNEAEVTLLPFLRDLEQGSAKRVYASSEFHSIFARLSIRLRVLQHHCPAGTPAACQGGGTDHSRAGWVVSPGLARLRILRGRQPDRQQETAQKRAAAGDHQMA
jgi:radical SAM superfamily enzyme YgiQ (UPF0313 family)